MALRSNDVVLELNSPIFVAGHRGLVGSAVVRYLQKKGFQNLLLRSRSELDLRNSEAVTHFFERYRPEYVVLAAAKVGGIGANSTFPVEFLLENVEIQNNVIRNSADFEVKKLLFLGSSCIYPKLARYPLTEDQLLNGPFEPTNEAYALAKVMGIKLCQAYTKQYGKRFISLMPTNLYGPNDFYHLENSHVIPALILKVLQAKRAGRRSVTLWGSGKPMREFLHSDDLASAIYTCLDRYDDSEIINVGSGQEVTIEELANLIARTCEFDGQILWDQSKPDGTLRKPLDSSKIRKLGWVPQIDLEEGLRVVVREAQSFLSEKGFTEKTRHYPESRQASL